MSKAKQTAKYAVKTPMKKRAPIPLTYTEQLAAQGLMVREQELKRDGDQLIGEIAQRNRLDPRGYGKDYTLLNGHIVFAEITPGE
jgi:hypothetical protein